MLQFLSAPSNFEIRARYRLRLGHKTSGPMCALTRMVSYLAQSWRVWKQASSFWHAPMAGRNPRTSLYLWPMHWVLRPKSRRRKSTNLFPTNRRRRPLIRLVLRSARFWHSSLNSIRSGARRRRGTVQGESGGLGLGYVDINSISFRGYPETELSQHNPVRDHQTHPVYFSSNCCCWLLVICVIIWLHINDNIDFLVVHIIIFEDIVIELS